VCGGFGSQSFVELFMTSIVSLGQIRDAFFAVKQMGKRAIATNNKPSSLLDILQIFGRAILTR
jgi:hypothetical protein